MRDLQRRSNGTGSIFVESHMNILFATGIYPPEIGGPATYVRALASECVRKGHDVTVVTYGDEHPDHERDPFDVSCVSRFGGPLIRWIRYALRLRTYGRDADVIYAFSSVSCGVPLAMARLRKPGKVLRLGGDFSWERYTDGGGTKGLREWYESNPTEKTAMKAILNTFDHIVFSTDFQQKLYEKHYDRLPEHSVIENALSLDGPLEHHNVRTPLRLLFMGRFVGFKNVSVLIEAMTRLDDATLTLVGSGPLEDRFRSEISRHELEGRVVLVEPVHGDQKTKLFREHDLLVLPSVTEISPNVALEARTAGLPVLLTTETGLSERLTDGMSIRSLQTADDIAKAVTEARSGYDRLASEAATAPPERSWQRVYTDHERLFTSLAR